jgi:hypothetical protein
LEVGEALTRKDLVHLRFLKQQLVVVLVAHIQTQLAVMVDLVVVQDRMEHFPEELQHQDKEIMAAV